MSDPDHPGDPSTAFAAAARRVAAGADHHAEAAALVASMTDAERLGCLDGDTDFWPGMADMTSGGYHRHPWPAAKVERLGIPGIDFVDGPRGCVVGPATCFPVSMARGAAFDPDLEERIGEAVGAEIRAVGGTYTGAVCLNLLRHPGWGRAQETYGEEPYHVGELAAALTRGLQRHVLACMKHFALNSMENARFTVDVDADERALHEVYLPHFRRVAEEGVASTMSAYNAVNGTWCGEHPVLLTDILRDEWGWDGFVITDFMFGLRDPIASVGAGCEIEMPFRQQRDQVVAEALADGRLARADVDRAVTRIVATLLRFPEVFDHAPDPSILAGDAHRRLAREAAVAGTVLVRNEGVLPVDPATIGTVAVLGRLAAVPNLGDGGSSDVHPPTVVTLLDGVRGAFADAEVRHDARDATVAAGADLTVVVVGCTKADEGEYIDADSMGGLFALFPPMPASRPSEPDRRGEARPADEGFAPGGDRRTLRLSSDDEGLIAAAVASATGPVVVCTMGGSAIVMPWLDTVDAALHLWYPGMEGGAALGDVLVGAAEPRGRLPFAVPHDEADLVHFDPDATTETYGLLHGHWHLAANGIEPHLAFGHGLGYTTMAVLGVEPAPDQEPDRAHLRVEVANTGGRDGSTVVFAFAGLPGSAVVRPERRLVGFARVSVAAGATAEVDLAIDWRQLDVRRDGAWWTEPGDYRIEIGQHAGDAAVVVDVDRPARS